MKITLDEIIAQLDIKSFFARYGVNIKKERGNKCEGSCPLCRDEKHFNLNTKNSLWKCWSCNESGNIVTFLKKLGHIDPMKIIREEAGIEEDESNVVPITKSRSKRGQKKTPNAEARLADRPVIHAIYGRVCELLPLTDIHRQQLKNKRGFSNDTIELLRFRSLGPHAANIIEGRLRSEFDEEDLIESGILVRAPGSGRAILNNQLTEDRILIPYLDAGGGAEEEDGSVTAEAAARSTPLDGDMEDTRRPSGCGDAATGEGGSGGAACTDEPGARGAPRRAAVKPGPGETAVYYLRPHKLGFEKLSPQIYCRYFLQKLRPAEHVVLTEGEFKAAALWQWGIPAVAVPGVSSFGLKHMDRLVALFREFGARKVTVIFDNEIKDNPEYPNYKPKASDRYDTELWSYLMAYKLGREGFDPTVGRLPDQWREQGKVDFDTALAQGRTRQDILNVIARAKPPKEYLELLPEEPRRIVQRKISMHFTRLAIRREFNRYVVTRHRGTDVYDETISNFVINIKSSFFTPEGVFRNIQLVNEYGEASDMFTLEPSDMAGLNEFKKFCFGAGNYVFEGKGDDLVDIWKLEFARDSGELIMMPEKIGGVKKKLWLFGTMAIVGRGKILRPDSDQVFWIEGKGYKPRSLTIEKEKF